MTRQPLPLAVARRLQWWVESHPQDPAVGFVQALTERVEKIPCRLRDPRGEERHFTLPRQWGEMSLVPLLDQIRVCFSVDAECITITGVSKKGYPKPHTNLIGKTFGLWTVVAYSGYCKRTKNCNTHTWEVRCACGSTAVLTREDLRLPGSCGCDPRYPSYKELHRKYVAEKRQTKPAGYLLELTRKCAEVRKGKVPCTLQEEDIEIPDVCPLRKVPLEVRKHGTPNSPAIVRFDPLKGFVPGNIIVTSWKAAQELREVFKPLEPLSEELLGDLVDEVIDPHVFLDAFGSAVLQECRFVRSSPTPNIACHLVSQGLQRKRQIERVLGLSTDEPSLDALLQEERMSGHLHFDPKHQKWSVV